MHSEPPASTRPNIERSMTALMSACVVVVVAMVAGINLALPELAGSDLHPSSTGLLWIVDAYILMERPVGVAEIVQPNDAVPRWTHPDSWEDTAAQPAEVRPWGSRSDTCRSV